MALALVANTWLDENSLKIRGKPVPWEGYQRAGLVTSEELTLIKRVDRQPRTKIDTVLMSDGPIYASLYLRLLKKLARVDTMQCLLVLIADALTEHDERIPFFMQTAEEDPELPFGPFLRALETQDDFVQLKATQILTTLLSSEAGPVPLAPLRTFLATLANLIQSSSLHKRDVAVQSLETLLPRPGYRSAVWSIPGIVLGLSDILKHNPGPQMSYQVGFCLWLLTFEVEIAEEINKKYDIVPVLLEVAQTAVKEKVTRVIIATFRNLVTKAPGANLPAMLVAKLLPFVKNLGSRKWSDDEVIEDIQFLREELTARFDSLSTYDEYTSELDSGHLSWSPVHESDAFWKENAARLNDKDNAQLKTLIHLLQTSQEPLVLAVAAHDIGQYVKHCDKGKKEVTLLGGKTRVMELMTHEDPDVRYQALISVQRLVSQPWRVA